MCVHELLERERELVAIEVLLERGGGLLVIEGGAGLGKTSLVDAACRRAEGHGYAVLRARGSELEAGFAWGVVLQLFERRFVGAAADVLEVAFAGPAGVVRPLVVGGPAVGGAAGGSFAVVHGLYWLCVNLAAGRPLLLVVDDAHWADEPSLLFLAYLAGRLDGLPVGLVVALRPPDPTSAPGPLLALHGCALGVLRPCFLSRDAVTALVLGRLGARATGELCTAVWDASGGNPLYVAELVRSFELARAPVEVGPAGLPAGGSEGIARRVIADVRRVDPHALRLVQALAVLGDGCELRHAAAIAEIEPDHALRVVAAVVRLGVLASGDPPCFGHPIVREALESSLGSDELNAAHRGAALLLHSEGAAPGQVAAHLAHVLPAGDPWVLARLREAAQSALAGGAPAVAADLYGRVLAEPPSSTQRLPILREAARAEASAGRARARARTLRRRWCWPHPRVSARRSRSRWPRSTRRCSGGSTLWT